MIQRLPTSPPHSRCTASAGATPGALRKATVRKEAQLCGIAVVLCSAEARLPHQKPTGARRDQLWSCATSPLDASRDHSRALAANARQKGEPGRTHLAATCDAHQPTQTSIPALRQIKAARDANRQSDGPAGPLRHPPPQSPRIAAHQQRKGKPVASRERSRDLRPLRFGAPQGVAAPSPRRLVPRHARRLWGGARPLAGLGHRPRSQGPPRRGEPRGAALRGSPRCPMPRHAHRLRGNDHPLTVGSGAADGARVRAVRACSCLRLESAAATQPQMCVKHL